MRGTTHEAGKVVLAAAYYFGYLCGQQRVQQAGRAAAVFERGVHRAVRPDAAGADYASCIEAVKAKYGTAIAPIVATKADANKAVTVVWGILLGLAVFGEAVTPRQVIGAVIIICGIVLFVRADNEGEGGQ